MTPTTNSDHIRMLLGAMTDLLAAEGETRTADVLVRLTAELDECAGDANCSAGVVRQIAALYQQGMGGFQDMVIQDATGVRPAQRLFDELRRRLFTAVRAELR